MSKVSLLMLTMDRYELTGLTLQKNLLHATRHHDFELLVADNGSKDKRVINFIQGVTCLKYFRENKTNEGVGRAFNQLYLRATGDYICLLGNDIELPNYWMDEMVKYAAGVPNSGIIGMDWGHNGMPPLTEKFGIHGHWLTPMLNRVFGVWLMRREVIEKVGLFPEHYDVYGLEDSSFNERVNRSQFNSVYVPNTHWKSKHVGTGDHDKGDYRKMKDLSMGRNLHLLSLDVAKWDKGAELKEPLPTERGPI